VGPGDLSLVELHDSSAVTELITYESLGLCAPGGHRGLRWSAATARSAGAYR
jgi:acetyl-CoA acyltransferase